MAKAKESWASNLRRENESLRAQLKEAQEVVRAIQQGEVDAVVVGGPGAERVYTLGGAEHAYRVLVETMGEGVAALSAGGDIRYSNSRLAAILAIPPPGATGASLRDYVSPASREQFQQMLSVGPGEVQAAVLEFRTASGGEVPAHVSLSRAEPGGPGEIWVVVTDLAELRRTERALKAREEELHLILSHAPVILFAVDSSGTITLWEGLGALQGNREACQLVGSNVSKLGDDLACLDDGVRRGLAGEATTVTCGVSGREYEIALSPLRDERGQVARLICMATDITERVLAEREQGRLRIQLIQAQKMEAIGALAGGIAHNFNNLMHVVSGYARRMLKKTAEAAPLRLDIEEVLRASERATRLTGQLLAFSRSQVLELKPIALNDVVTAMESMLRVMLAEDVILRLALAATLPGIMGDCAQLEQVILNLTTNAHDAMPRGGQLIVSTAVVDVAAKAMRGDPELVCGHYVMLSVTDTGVGIDERTQARMFEPFFTSKGLGKGNGLGLATVYGIVKQSGGHIAVESALGQGTTIRIYFPPVEQPAGDAPRRDGISADRGGKESILVVEDESAIRGLTATDLAELGYVVMEAGTAEEAIRKASDPRVAIDLLLTDVVLPDQNGTQLARVLRTSRPGLKVLLMSGYAEKSLVERGVRLGEKAFIQKPFSNDALVAKVREVLLEP